MDTKTFDWDIAIERANGNQDLARELGGLLFENIKELLPEIQDAWHSQDTGQLIQLTHKMHGGAAYTGAIKLQQAAKSMEKSLHNGEINHEQYEILLKCVKDYSVFFESLEVE